LYAPKENPFEKLKLELFENEYAIITKIGVYKIAKKKYK